MKTQETTISIWRDAIGYDYSDDNTFDSRQSMMESFGMLIARLAATLQHSEDTDEIVRYDIEVTKTVYND